MLEKEEFVIIRIVDKEGNVHYKFELEKEELQEMEENKRKSLHFGGIEDNVEIYDMVLDEEELEEVKEEIEEIKEILAQVNSQIDETKPKSEEEKKKTRKRIFIGIACFFLFIAITGIIEGWQEDNLIKNGKQKEATVVFKLERTYYYVFPRNELDILVNGKYESIPVKQEVFDKAKMKDKFKVIIYKGKVHLDPREEYTKAD
ncbi:hypothetical protein SAMN04488168_1399 [Bacillus sp. 491mf]|uniref:hypothetical protein n=1 Tax=Bacillus sp. 491mf TaxID=1761755 RepID=UPI0008E5A5B7|nr:hypothetical protein [Bacillus sp. 491mf]SFD42459.1 hypothetical protein SAMN04488168_1399 [Bacillus sp. 491mf]